MSILAELQQQQQHEAVEDNFPASPSSSMYSSSEDDNTFEDQDDIMPTLDFVFDNPNLHEVNFNDPLLPAAFHDFGAMFQQPRLPAFTLSPVVEQQQQQQQQHPPATATTASADLFPLPQIFSPTLLAHRMPLPDAPSPTLRKRQRLVVATKQMEDIVSAIAASPPSPTGTAAIVQSKPLARTTSNSSLGSRSRTSSSAFRGVSRCTKDGRWQARIRIQKEVVYLGRFPTEELAARRYDEAARLNHGRQAVLNFITPEDVSSGCKSVFATNARGFSEDD